MITLEPGEQVVIEVHKHWITLLAQSLILIILLPIPLIVYKLIPLPSFINVIGNKDLLFIFFSFGWLLFLWIAFFIMWTFHHLDSWIVTNKRIIDIEQYSFFSRDVTSFRLDRIQDIKVETRGILATLFGFGSLHVQTAGEENDLKLPLARHPEIVRNTILRISDAQIEKFAGTQREI